MSGLRQAVCCWLKREEQVGKELMLLDEGLRSRVDNKPQHQVMSAHPLYA